MTTEQIREKFSRQPQGHLHALEQAAFGEFDRLGIPTTRNEEWKYTRLAPVWNKDYVLTAAPAPALPDFQRLPGSDSANELFFINGIYQSALSNIRSAGLTVQALETAAGNDFSALVSEHLGYGSKYAKDGIHALNTAFAGGGAFIHIKRGAYLDQPIYLYHISDTREGNILAQPRSLIYASEGSAAQLAEHCITAGPSDSFTNTVVEVVLQQDALVEYYKIQNDGTQGSQVSTNFFRQCGRSHLHAVTISLNGGTVRNNLNIALEAERCETHLYGLYFLRGNSHVDNHTLVDHIVPNCPSNELYKGVMDDASTAVFNGKIMVRPQAQKTNAYQSNKNLLLSDDASVNTKPQLEIFADDVKCSHGCTVGQLDEEGLFYLRSRGITEKTARALLVQAFAADILEHIKLPALRTYVDELIVQRLQFEAS